MHNTVPQVWLIARPSLDLMAIEDYLFAVGGEKWLDSYADFATPAEGLIEFAGRLCYRSWAPGLNANVTKVRSNTQSYLRNILSSRHGSVLEHANYTFVFHNVSRVFTHEVVRHRAGVAISQESLRFVRLTDLGFRVPEILKKAPDNDDDDRFEHTIINLVESLETFQIEAAARFGLDDDGVPFHYKKEVTSALRRLAPLGLSTGMVWTANVRTIRHVLAMRTALGAEEEIRFVFDEVGRIMMLACPYLFQDFTRSDDGVWTPEFDKV